MMACFSHASFLMRASFSPLATTTGPPISPARPSPFRFPDGFRFFELLLHFHISGRHYCSMRDVNDTLCHSNLKAAKYLYARHRPALTYAFPRLILKSHIIIDIASISAPSTPPRRGFDGIVTPITPPGLPRPPHLNSFHSYLSLPLLNK